MRVEAEFKLGGREVCANISSGQPGTLGFIRDSSNKKLFLVDTGSVFSIIPHQSSAPANGPRIVAADRTPIACWGRQQHTIRAGGREFKWTFLLAAVATPIVGADFLEAYNLLVDLPRRRLQHGTQAWIIRLEPPPPGSCFAAIGIQQAVEQLPPVETARRPPAHFLDRSTHVASVKAPSGSLAAPVPRDWSARASTASVSATSAEGQGCGTGLREGVVADAAGVGQDVQRTASTSERPRQAKQVTSREYTQILRSFPEVLNASQQLPPVKHHVEHHIDTEGHAVAAKYRRLDPDRLEAARKDFAELEKQGIIRRSKSHWASPLHLVKKSDGTWRPCGDFRRLNLQTKADRYTCPNMADLTARLAGCHVFTKLDLRKGYHQVPVRPADVHKTAITTPFGLFEFVRMPFGLRNAGQTFQRLMDEVLTGLSFVFVYLDDVLIASRDHTAHKEHLQQVLSIFRQHGLVLNGEKCVLGVSEVTYLGHEVSADGIKPLADRVEAVQTFPRPNTVKQLQVYLGMINFYRRFIPGAARVLKPMTDALRGSKRSALDWTAEMEQSFSSSKQGLASAVQLAHPNPAAELVLAVDASDTHVGAVLQQRAGPRGLQPLGFFSCKLDRAQLKYSAYDREMLAAYLGIRHFRWMLEGRAFVLESDHKPLSFSLHQMSDAWTARQQRQLSFIAEFTSEIKHVPGKQNVVADAMSRPAAAVMPAEGEQLNLEEMARAQQQCEQTLDLCNRLNVQQLVISGQELWCDKSDGTLRPLVPVTWRKAVFDSVHGLAHAGTRATRRMISNRWVWPGLAKNIGDWCRDCQKCARGKVTRQEHTTVQAIPIPKKKFSHVHVDLVGPLSPSSRGHTYLLTVVDRTSRWPEVIPLRKITAEVCVDAFVDTWVARYGVPHTITTDRGAQFTGSAWQEMCRSLGTQHVTTTSYHPQSNGMVERFHRQIKESLRARCEGKDWLEHLPYILLGLRAAPKEEAEVSSAEVMFGAPLVLPNQAQESLDAQHVEKSGQEIPNTTKSYAEVVKGGSDALRAATHVYVRSGPLGGPLTPTYNGPYKVLQRADKTLQLQLGPRADWVSIDRVKPHVGTSEVVPAQPPTRGRPPRKNHREDAQ